MNNLPLFYTKSYLQFQQECEEAFNWCKAKAPKLNKNHRFTKYRQNLQKLIDAKQKGTTHQLLGSISPEDLSTSLCALNELVIIYRGLSPLINQNELLSERLKKIIDGPFFEKNEKIVMGLKNTNVPRNFAFELLTASFFSLSGYQIKLDSDADLVVEDQNDIIFVECKRPTCRKTVSRNVHKAIDQLTNRLNHANSSKKTCGLIALSMSKIVNHELNFLDTKDGDIFLQLASIGEEFVRANECHWQKTLDHRIIGVLIHFSIPALISDSNLFTLCNPITFNNMTITNHPIGSYNDYLLNNIFENLRKNSPAWTS